MLWHRPGDQFTLENLRESIDQLKKLGSIRDILAHLPIAAELPGLDNKEPEMRAIQGIIDSMTPDERQGQDKIDTSRRRRIANGSGTHALEVWHLLEQFHAAKPLIEQMARANWEWLP